MGKPFDREDGKGKDVGTRVKKETGRSFRG